MTTEALLAAVPAPIPLSAGGHTFRMVPVQGGTFLMGDEGYVTSSLFLQKIPPHAEL